MTQPVDHGSQNHRSDDFTPRCVARALSPRAAARLESLQPEARAPGLPATRGEDLVYQGGKTIADLAFANLYVGGDAWPAADRQHIDDALAAAMGDRGLNNVLAQYFPAETVRSTFLGARVLAGPAPARMDMDDVEALVTRLYQTGALAAVAPKVAFGRTVFNLLLPPGTTLSTDSTNGGEVEVTGAFLPEREEADSLSGLGGYHGSVHLVDTAGQRVTVYYAVGVYSQELSDGGSNGIVAFDAPWKNVVATFYHELCEARTDPDVGDAIRLGRDPRARRLLGWISRHGEECGDFPIREVGGNLRLVMKEVPLANGAGTVPVQLQYSNAVHGPEGPIAQPHTLRRPVSGFPPAAPSAHPAAQDIPQG